MSRGVGPLHGENSLPLPNCSLQQTNSSYWHAISLFGRFLLFPASFRSLVEANVPPPPTFPAALTRLVFSVRPVDKRLSPPRSPGVVRAHRLPYGLGRLFGSA
ncbi:hypothetical protein Bbelb_134810 [Branchiostoma belcheri]|nr:hypothetical protein Bbelb_134810 [Branchiostoma belcheri]